MGLLARLRAFVLREHEREHQAINEHLSDADRELGELEVRLRRLEVAKRLRSRE